MTFDVLDGAEAPKRGDILRPGWIGGVAWYRVLDVRPVESRIWHDRWRLTVVRVDPDATRRGEGVADGARLIACTPYEKGEGPRELAARVKRDDPYTDAERFAALDRVEAERRAQT